MRITFDPAKRAKTLAERGLDFADAEFVFAGVTLESKTRVETMASRASSAMDIWIDAWLWWATHRVVVNATCSV
jgi:uncharacterized DUF497 family protein